MRFGFDSAMPPKLQRVVVRTHQIQVWFQHHQGVAMAKRWCQACDQERIFTIWCDGSYHCLRCLYRQAMDGQEGPIPIEPTNALMREFALSWLGFRRYSHEPIDDGWMLVAESCITAPMPFAPPKPVCQAEDCRACGTCRPHVRDAAGRPRCFHCLMKEGQRSVPPAQPKRPTRERLDAAARAAIAAMYPVV